MRRIPMHMKDWIKKLNGFLALNDRDILNHAGKISHDIAIQYAEQQYEKFNIKRIKENDAKESDFDHAVEEIEQKTSKRKSELKKHNNS